jgi:hypothetical protein
MAERLAYFLDFCAATGKRYVDWNAAFRNSVRGNWAKLQSLPQHGKAAM